MKLKTLKDLELYYSQEKKLKAEAIKWVKECPHRKHIWHNEVPLKCSACSMMVDFHNITLEDLMNKKK